MRRQEIIPRPLRSRARRATTLVEFRFDPKHPSHEWDSQDRSIPILCRELPTVDEVEAPKRGRDKSTEGISG
jgi:hypothetical protein